MKKAIILIIMVFMCMPLFAGKMRMAIMYFRAKDISKSDSIKVSELRTMKENAARAASKREEDPQQQNGGKERKNNEPAAASAGPAHPTET